MCSYYYLTLLWPGDVCLLKNIKTMKHKEFVNLQLQNLTLEVIGNAVELNAQKNIKLPTGLCVHIYIQVEY